MFLPIGWWVCVSLLVPAKAPAPAAAPTRPTDASVAAKEPPLRPVRAVHLAAKLDRYLDGAARTLDARPRAVLGRIPERERRALAVAHYLRQRDQVDMLWTWSEAERRSYEQTDRYRRTMADIRRVTRTFAELNPGYRLVANTAGRPLTTQVIFWNRERSVAAAGRELHDSSLVWLADESFPDLPDSVSLVGFIERLARYQPARLPTVAVPGLSMHGRLRAFDFAVLRRGEVVAGTTSTTIDSVWDRGGWAEKLRLAVTVSGGDLAGPLEAPREPWHYEYRPEMR
jgi:hypothetical protein